MQRITLAILILAAFASTAHAQSPEAVIQAARKRCIAIQEGHYTASHRIKYMTMTDTLAPRLLECTFHKRKGDKLFPAAFLLQRAFGTGTIGHALYTGQEFITGNPETATADVMRVPAQRKDISDISHNYDLYGPIMHPKAEPLPSGKGKHLTYIALPDEAIEGQECHHIRIVSEQRFHPRETIHLLSAQLEFWIRKNDHLPIQYTTSSIIDIQGDTMTQYTETRLLSADFTTPVEAGALAAQAFPTNYALREYTPRTPYAAMAPGTTAPAFSCLDLDGNTTTLADHAGKVVLLDFFYRSCYPCMLAMPHMQALHEKYAAQGLVILGMDPKDRDPEPLRAFLHTRGVTYPILLANETHASAYHVSGYPTVVLIGRDGKVAHVEVGFGEGTPKELEAAILKLL